MLWQVVCATVLCGSLASRMSGMEYRGDMDEDSQHLGQDLDEEEIPLMKHMTNRLASLLPVTDAATTQMESFFGKLPFSQTAAGGCLTAGCEEAAFMKLFRSIGGGSSISGAAYKKMWDAPVAQKGLPVATPAQVGLSAVSLQLMDAELQRRAPRYCLAVIKDGKLVYTSGDTGTPHYAFSLTKTLAGVLVGMATATGKLDIYKNISAYGFQSPVDYEVTTAMIMSQAIAGEEAGQLFEYDTFGLRWLNKLMQIIFAATGRKAKGFFDELVATMELGMSFSGEDAAHSATGSCIDFAKLGQLILAKGRWDGVQVVPKKFVEEMGKAHPYGVYEKASNPCYGYMVWLLGPTAIACPLSDKGPGNFPASPDGETAIVAAATLGQVTMIIPSSRMVVTSMGSEYLRSIIGEHVSGVGGGEEHIGGITALNAVANALKNNGMR